MYHTQNTGLALCIDATLGIRALQWVPAGEPTVHRGPKGEAVGDPLHHKNTGANNMTLPTG